MFKKKKEEKAQAEADQAAQKAELEQLKAEKAENEKQKAIDDAVKGALEEKKAEDDKKAAEAAGESEKKEEGGGDAVAAAPGGDAAAAAPGAAAEAAAPGAAAAAPGEEGGVDRLAEKKKKEQAALKADLPPGLRVFQMYMKALKARNEMKERVDVYLKVTLGGDYEKKEVPYEPPLCLRNNDCPGPELLTV